MAENLLSFNGSEQFRNKLVAKNLKPYTIPGSYTYDAKNQNYEVAFADKTAPVNQDISSGIFDEPKVATRMNTYGSGFKIDGSELLGNAGAVSMQQAGTGNVQVLNSEQQVEYSQSYAELELLSEFYIDSAAVVNKYVPRDGYIYTYYNSEKILAKSLTGEYPNFDFISDDALGSLPPFQNIFSATIGGGLFSNDSYLQQISTQYLKNALEERISREVYRNTIGKVNLAAFSDPFQASLLASGQQPLIYKNYTITVPDGVFDQAAFLLQKFSGTYIPTSPIEGDYFTEPQRQKGAAEQFVDSPTNRFTRPANPNTNPSIKFLNNTGSGQKNVLFTSLGYNRFKPEYELNTTQFGLVVDNIFNKENSLTNFYVGSETADVSQVTSPQDMTPTDAYGNKTNSIVFGPDVVGKLYEGDALDQTYNFGLKTMVQNPTGVFVDIALQDQTGGFFWTDPRTSPAAGKFPTKGGGEGATSPIYNQGIGNKVEAALSTRIPGGFTKGSILDETQRLIESAPISGAKRLVHVGNAINQVSKVFNDGYKEMTKGSRVMKYVNQNGRQVGTEYCRVFAKDIPYLTYSNLQSTVANTSGAETSGNIRRFSYSVLDTTYNLNISPTFGESSTNIKDGKVKKYMFSIENLAWRGTPEYDALPDCEKGPNGGRIMWFPPYDITLGQESSSPKFNQTNFLGRPEPVYTYENTSRSSSISWSIIVDHPSISNLIAKKVLEREDDNTATQVMASFFAGCQKYDIYELAQRYSTLSRTTIEEAYQQVLQSNQTTNEDKKEALNSAGDTGAQNITESQTNVFGDYINYGFYFPYTFNGNEGTTNYNTIYDNYVASRNSYIGGAQQVQMTLFFNDFITTNYSKMNDLKEQIKKILENDEGIVEITFDGTRILGRANNDITSTAWFDSAVLFFTESVLSNNKRISDYVSNGKIVFKKKNLGTVDSVSGLTTSSGTGDSINCNDPNITPPINSFEAAACRAVRISNIVVTPNKPTDSSGAETQSDENIPNPDANFGKKPEQQPQIENKVRGVSKKIIRELLTECSYFEVIKNTDKIIYESITQRFKFFNPAFHAITPEGLNSRLVFLQQCVRPGRTIPTKISDNETVITDSFNTNFGSPPVLILRFGDFYNTKIIPNSLSITYENLLDINPEGIGVQPMIAKVTLSFDMIGGHGLKGPVEKLQNALSFNYYANTEMYDERADETESTEAVDKALIDAIRNEEPLVTVNSVNDTVQNEGGTLLGASLTLQIADDGIQTGTNRYNDFFNGFIDTTSNYFVGILNNYETFVNEYNMSVWAQVNYSRAFTFGYYLNTYFPDNLILNILGKQGNWETSLSRIGDIVKSNIDNETDSLIFAISGSPTINATVKSKVKENYKSYIDTVLANNFTKVATYIQEMVQVQLGFTTYMQKMDLVGVGGDGKILANGAAKLYVLSGETEDNQNTLSQFSTDYVQIMTDSNNFYSLGLNRIFYDSSATSGTITNYSGITSFSNPKDFYVYTLLSNIVLNNNTRPELIDALVKNVQPEHYNSTKLFVTNFITNNWLFEFTTEKNAESESLTDFKSTTQYKFYSKYNPTDSVGRSLSTRQRVMGFTTIAQDAPLTSVNYWRTEAIKDIYRTVNTIVNPAIFNGKKQFNN
jgi:hypothetical protein